MELKRYIMTCAMPAEQMLLAERGKRIREGEGNKGSPSRRRDLPP